MYQQERFKEYNNIQISKNTDKFLKCKQLTISTFYNLNINAIINKNLQQTKFVILLLQNSFV